MRLRLVPDTKAPKADEFFLATAAGPITAVVQEACKRNFLAFMKAELGMEIGQHHKTWNKHLHDPENDVVEMAPRDHGKSMSLARAYPIWKLKYDDWVKEVYILGPDQDSAVENLDKLKQMMEAIPSLRELIPTNRSDGFNSRTEVRLRNGKIIRAKGWLSPLRGRHPQLIILDDVLNENNSMTPEHRVQTLNYFNQVVVPMKAKPMGKERLAGYRSQIVIVGTAQHKEDMYHALLKTPGYTGVKLKAIISHENEEVLWPERYTYEDLIKIRVKIGPLTFSREYQNEPISEETSIFPPSLFEPLKDPTLSYQTGYNGPNPTFMGVDFNVPGSTDGDYTVIFIMEKDDNLFRPLHFWRKRARSTQEQIHQIELLCQTFKVTRGMLEDNMFQKVYAEHFRQNSTLPLSGHTVTRQGKNSETLGVLSFRPLFENGRFVFPYKTQRDKDMTDLIVTEFGGTIQRHGKIGNEEFHDDILMAMWHSLVATRTDAFEASW